MRIRQALIDEITNRREWYVQKQIFHRIDRMLDSLKVYTPGPCSVDKWMSMPSLGEAMANAFETAVFFFSQHGSQSFLPYFCPPIFIAHVPSHFVALEMFDPVYFPAPRLLDDWKQEAVPEALPWENKYSACHVLTVGRKLLFPETTHY
jgi:hypothetical protein